MPSKKQREKDRKMYDYYRDRTPQSLRHLSYAQMKARTDRAGQPYKQPKAAKPSKAKPKTAPKPKTKSVPLPDRAGYGPNQIFNSMASNAALGGYYFS